MSVGSQSFERLSAWPSFCHEHITSTRCVSITKDQRRRERKVITRPQPISLQPYFDRLPQPHDYVPIASEESTWSRMICWKWKTSFPPHTPPLMRLIEFMWDVNAAPVCDTKPRPFSLRATSCYACHPATML